VAGHVLLVVLFWGLWLLIGIAFPLYALARAAVLGYQSGLVVRLPAKIFVILLLGYATSSAAHAAQRLSSNTCFQLEYSADRLYTFVLPAFVAAMLIARHALFEPRLSRKIKREGWSARLRTADGVAGAVLEVIAAVFVLDLVVLAMGITNSPVTNYPATFLSSGIFRGVPLIDDLPAVFEGILQLEQNLHVSQSAYATLMQHCPASAFSADTYSGMYLWTFGLAGIICGPLAFLLAFQSLTYLNKTFRHKRVQGTACEECGGYGIYGLDKPLLFAGLCERCLGTGRPESDGQTVSYPDDQDNLAGRKLLVRSYGVALIVFGAIPLVVEIVKLHT
jgi:hypothetical protein